ncbi:MAG: condensation domain-containing protein, partial [Actinobacteria bacterium]|nr:condensation domain-containing protein [Actinomycetota bacterium]
MPAIPAVPREGALPLSFAQQRLWFLDQFEPDSAEYITPSALRLCGELDSGALSRALTTLVARHESLRTTFDSVDGRGVQVVHAPYAVSLPMLDLAGLPEEERRTELDRVVAEEALRPFDLGGGPLLRTRLVRLAADEHVLTMMLHHIVTDGWSGGVIMSDLSELYRAELSGTPPDLTALPVQYADFAVWQRERLSGSMVEAQLSFWRRQLDGVAALELPTDRPRPGVHTNNGALLEFVVPAQVTARLKELGRHQDGTLFMTLVAACQLLLHRWSGQDDIAVGTVTSGRDRAELEGLVGFFVNTLVLRSQVDNERTFSEFLSGVKATVLDAFAHQDVPFERLVDELQPERDTSRTPLFDAMIVLQNTPNQACELPGLEVEDVELPMVTASFDISIEFQESDGGLYGALTYNTDLFDAASIERMAAHLQVLLEGIVAGPDRQLVELQWMSEVERYRVLVEWNDTGLVVSSATVASLFAEQVIRTPEATAVISDVGALSYAELDARANLLAHRLIGLGVGPEGRVGVLVERSVELVVAVLAVVKAGGAYLPVDVRAPAERMRLGLAEAGASVLITDRVWRAVAESVHTGRMIVVDGDPSLAEEPAGAPAVVVCPDNLVYTEYTSGSTGVPKGVAVRHRDVVALALDRRFVGGGHERVLLHSPLAFDASTYELWVPLLRGGRVVVA